MTGQNGPSEISQLSPNSEHQEADFYKIALQRELYKQQEWADKLWNSTETNEVLHLDQSKSM